MITFPSFIQFFLESSICLILFYLFYHWILSKTTFFQSNRGYLILAPILAILIPCIQISSVQTIQEYTPVPLEFIPQTIQEIQQTESVIYQNFEPVNASPTWQWIDLTIWIYGIIALFFLLKLVRNLWKIRKMIKGSKIKKQHNYIQVYNQKNKTPFSFFNYLFWNNTDENDSWILEHELVHIQQKHSIDIIFIEIIVALFWFHPVIYLFRKAIKMNHEFIADDWVNKKYREQKKYVQLILSNHEFHQTPLTSKFNSFIKNRIVMIYKTQTSRIHLLRYFLILPLFFLLMSVFSLGQQNQNSNRSFYNSELSFLKHKILAKKSHLQLQNKDINMDDRYQYVFRFKGDHILELQSQKADVSNTRPPIHVITFETAKKILSSKLSLFELNSATTHPFTMDIEIGKDNFDKNSKTIPNANLKIEIKKLNKKQPVYFFIKNIKSPNIDKTLNVNLAIIPKKSFIFNWGNYDFAPNQEVKMTAKEFKHYMGNISLGVKNAEYINEKIHFIKLEKTDKDGIRQIFDTKGHYVPRVYSDLDDEYPHVMNATAGDRYFFKNICLESPLVPCNYSFSVLIVENELARGLPKKEFKGKIMAYIIDGKNSNEEEFKKLKKEDIESFTVHNRWGEEVTLKEKGHLVIVIKTKK